MADNIIFVLDECISPKKCHRTPGSVKLGLVINKAIEYIGKEVVYGDEKILLSWHHLEAYLNEHKPEGEELYAHIMSAFHQRLTIQNLSEDHQVKATFNEQQSAIAFCDFLSHILPFSNAEYPKITHNTIMITQEQYFFCNRFAQHGTGKLNAEYLNDCLLKTLRADKFDFSYQFILGIIPTHDGTRRLQNLRPIRRRPFTISPAGKIAARVNKQPVHTPEEKEGFSQIQSCTYIDNNTRSGAFGFTRGRDKKLYGLMTHCNDALISRMLIEDSGTVSRIFDYQTLEEAQKSTCYSQYSNSVFYHPKQITSFKTINQTIRLTSDRTNEVLARLRFNPYRSVVSICSDTLEARLLAYDFAQELLQHFAAFAESNGQSLNPNFRIPIIFYVPTGHFNHTLRFYTADMYQNDRIKALTIFADETKRNACYDQHNFEFLLGLNLASFSPTDDNISHYRSVAKMIKAGYTRMLLRLQRHNDRMLYPLTQADSSKAIVTDARADLSWGRTFAAFVKHTDIATNDRFIAQFILAEAFDIADQLIKATKSDKTQLPYEESTLVEHLIRHGNPRQLKFMGLNQMLIRAAKINSWVVIRLCIKEFPTIDKVLLGALLLEACASGVSSEVSFLLQNGADKTQLYNQGETSIAFLADIEDWKLASLFSQYPTDPSDKAGYGFAVLMAIRDKQPWLAKLLLAAGAKTTWRHRYQWDHVLESTLFYAVEHGYTSLLPLLIDHEKYQNDDFHTVRYLLALDLADINENKTAVRLLTQSTPTVSPIDPDNILRSICRLVLEALAIGQARIAKKRLFHYLHHYRLLTVDNYNVADGLTVIMEYFYDALHSQSAIDYGDIVYRAILKNLSTEIILDFKEVINKLDPDKRRQKILDETLAWAVKQSLHDTIYFALKLGALPYHPAEDSVIVDTLHHNNPRLAQYFLANFSFCESTLNSLFNMAIDCSNKTDFPLSIIPHLKQVTADHLELLADKKRYDLIPAILGRIDKKYYFDVSFRHAFFKTWIIASNHHPMIANQLINMLGAIHIRHFTLMYLLCIIHYSGMFHAFAPGIDVRLHWRLNIAERYGKDLKNYMHDYVEVNSYQYNPHITDKTMEIFNVLGKHFFNYDPYQPQRSSRENVSDEMSLCVFKNILTYFEHRVNSHSISYSISTLFYRDSNKNEFNAAILDYLRKVETLLTYQQPKSVKHAACIEELDTVPSTVYG